MKAALESLSAGYRPIPIKPNTKEPCVRWQLYQHKSPTKEEIISWWTQWPNANIAIITGEASGVDVIDFDIGHDPWPPEGYQLPRSCIVETPSGGLHYYMRHTKDVGCSYSKLAKNIDVKADGGSLLSQRYLNKVNWLRFASSSFL